MHPDHLGSRFAERPGVGPTASAVVKDDDDAKDEGARSTPPSAGADHHLVTNPYEYTICIKPGVSVVGQSIMRYVNHRFNRCSVGNVSLQTLEYATAECYSRQLFSPPVERTMTRAIAQVRGGKETTTAERRRVERRATGGQDDGRHDVDAIPYFVAMRDILAGEELLAASYGAAYDAILERDACCTSLPLSDLECRLLRRFYAQQDQPPWSKSGSGSVAVVKTHVTAGYEGVYIDAFDVGDVVEVPGGVTCVSRLNRSGASTRGRRPATATRGAASVASGAAQLWVVTRVMHGAGALGVAVSRLLSRAKRTQSREQSRKQIATTTPGVTAGPATEDVRSALAAIVEAATRMVEWAPLPPCGQEASSRPDAAAPAPSGCQMGSFLELEPLTPFSGVPRREEARPRTTAIERSAHRGDAPREGPVIVLARAAIRLAPTIDLGETYTVDAAELLDAGDDEDDAGGGEPAMRFFLQRHHHQSTHHLSDAHKPPPRGGERTVTVHEVCDSYFARRATARCHVTEALRQLRPDRSHRGVRQPSEQPIDHWLRDAATLLAATTT